MPDTPGSSKLTLEQTVELEQMTGLRYTHVQDGTHGLGVSRRDRRAHQRAQQRAALKHRKRQP